MEMLDFVSSQIISTMGWTIIHSLWQGLLISLLLATILVFIDKKNARMRSIISYFALFILLAVSIRTYLEVDKSSINEHQTFATEYSTNDSETFIQNRETSLNFFSSEEVQSVISEYTATANNFLSTNINLIVLLWFAGIMILSFRLLGGIFYTQRLKFREVIPADPFWERQTTSLCTKFGITKNVRLLQSKLVKFPITIGYFKPVILLPLGLISGIPHNQLEIILAHELAHIKRADYIMNIFQSIVEVLFFFNPAVWWISKTIRAEREYLCDDLAIETCGNSITLAKALLFVESGNYSEIKIAMSAIGSKHSLMGRIKRMTHSKNEKKAFSATLTIVPILLLITFMVFSRLDSEIIAKDNSLLQPSGIASISFASSSAEPTEAEFSSRESTSVGLIESSVNYATNVIDDDKRIKLSFYEDNIHWKAYFEEDKLVELFKDGEEVLVSDFSKYEDFVYEQYIDFEEDMADLDIQMDQLKIDMNQLKIDLSGLKDININLDFDSEEFVLEMKNMKQELKKELGELKELDFDIDINMDFSELKESLKNIKIDLSGFDKDMASLEIELTGLKEELKILKYFLNDLKDELVEDGYIEESDEYFELVLSKSKMIVNDKYLPDEMHQKYLELYKEHYGKDLDDDFRVLN